MNSYAIIKEKSVFVTCLKEGTQSNATTLWDLSLKCLFGELIICAFLFSKVVAWSHYSLLGCYLECVHHLVPNARTHAYFIQSMLLICITHIQDEVV